LTFASYFSDGFWFNKQPTFVLFHPSKPPMALGTQNVNGLPLVPFFKARPWWRNPGILGMLQDLQSFEFPKRTFWFLGEKCGW